MYNVHIAARYNGRILLILRRVISQHDLVRIVMVGIQTQDFRPSVTTSIDLKVDWRRYLPICSSRKETPQRTRTQLHLRSSAPCWMEVEERSYNRNDTTRTVPLQILKKTPLEGRAAILTTKKSLQAVQQCLNRRAIQVAVEQSAANV